MSMTRVHINEAVLAELPGYLKGAPQATTVDETLAERGSRYGDFGDHAGVTQALKRAMGDSPNWRQLPDDMRESLEMVAHKIGRILCGDPTYLDSWHDIIGYTRLIEKRLEAPEAKEI